MPKIHPASELIQNIFRVNLTFSTDSEGFQNSFCIHSQTSLNQSEIQNKCSLKFFDSEESSESFISTAHTTYTHTHTHKSNRLINHLY